MPSSEDKSNKADAQCDTHVRSSAGSSSGIGSGIGIGIVADSSKGNSSSNNNSNRIEISDADVPQSLQTNSTIVTAAQHKETEESDPVPDDPIDEILFVEARGGSSKNKEADIRNNNYVQSPTKVESNAMKTPSTGTTEGRGGEGCAADTAVDSDEIADDVECATSPARVSAGASGAGASSAPLQTHRRRRRSAARRCLQA